MRNLSPALRDRSSSDDMRGNRGFATEDPPRQTPTLNDRASSAGNQFREALVRKILVPTDFSPASARALARAVALGSEADATVTILHVIDINAPHESGAASDLMQRLWAEGSTRMCQLASSFCGQGEARTALEEGLPWEKIVEKSRDFDLVVIGKSRARNGWNLFSSRTVHRVIEDAACPVLVVHEEG